ncbi:uncharacterized protein LOC131229077 [Magnolia sinica]|uniref:uncharacterized protein LOC131229077 n=1 Tax=Magnolia sinica TaxID=86752 RepID=UPI002657EF75|nr:uncharacterized protein LOC131229077 [Magnolia sinica]
MASNLSTKSNETRKADGEKETRVQAVDYHSSAVQGQMERQRDVEVIHQLHPSDGNSGQGGALAGATAAVVNSIQSAKDAISGNASESKKT